jgi:MobA/MobL family
LREKGFLNAMAKYFLRVKTFSRGKGSSAIKAAAYRAGERIRDEHSSAVYDYTDRTDVVHSQIMLPSEDANNVDLNWARNRSVLWNAVQRSGRNWNSRLAREVLVILPPELTSAQRTALIRSFSQELADRYRCAVDFAVHEPRANADQRHHHAHMLMTCRQPGPQGVGARTTLELSGTERHQRGLGPSKDELLWTRERWAQVANEALRNAGLAANMDHRSYQDQGVDREPKAFIPQKVFYAERRHGASTPAGNNVRSRHRERLEARMKGPEELARVLKRQRETGRKRAIRSSEQQTLKRKIPTGAMTREQLNAKRHEYCKANAAKISCQRRERRRANAAEVNRKQREYRRKRIVEKTAAKLALSAEANTPAKKNALASVAEQRKLPASRPTSHTASAEASVKKWLAFRESQKGIVSKDPIEKWKEYRKAQTQTASLTSRDHSHDPDNGARSVRAGEGAKSKQKRGPKNDLGL